MATINLGTIGFTFRGAYDAATTYSKQDIVTEGVDTYISLIDSNTGTTPGTDATKWSIFTNGIGQGTGTPAGGIWYYDGTSVQSIAPTSANQVLRVDEATNLPVWTEDDQRSSVRVANLNHPNTNSYRYGAAIMEDGTWRSWGYNAYYQQGIGSETSNRPNPTTAAFPPDFSGVKLSERKLVNRNKRTVTHTVTMGTDSNGDPIFVIDGTDNPNIDMTKGNIYKFDQTDSTNTEDLVFEESTDGGTTWTSLTLADIGDKDKTTVYTAPGLTAGTDRVTYIRIGDEETDMYRYVGSTTATAGNTITLNTNGFVYEYANKGWYWQFNYQQMCMAVDNNNNLWTWGRNHLGEHGTGNTTDVYVPQNASSKAANSLNGKNVIKCVLAQGGTSVSTYNGAWALCDDGTIHYCGYGNYGSRGDGNTTTTLNFVQASPQLGKFQTASLDQFVDLWAGNQNSPFAIAQGKDGTIYHCGYSGNYTSGQNPVSNSNNTNYTKVAINVPAAEILFVTATGGYVRDIDGNLWTWGQDSHSTHSGALGQGTHGNLPPTIVMNNTQANGDTTICECVAATFIDQYNTAIIRDAAGVVYSSGYNGYGQLLDGGVTARKNFVSIPSSSPTVVWPGEYEPTGYPNFPSNVKRMAVSGSGSYLNFCVLTDDGEVLCWGYNGHGQIGVGDTTSHSNSGKYNCLGIAKEVIDIALYGHSNQISGIALTEDGNAYTWGYSAEYSLGNENYHRYAPTMLQF
jgi:alpha-tubulin suppressor-like RCC1 family protein